MSSYAEEVLGEDDDGTMPNNVATLREAVVGHRIGKVGWEHIEDQWYDEGEAFVITLDNGKRVGLFDGGDCCAYTHLKAFLLHPDRVDHIITGVGTTGEYTTWHIYADMGDVLDLTVSWSADNPFYDSYGFSIVVREPRHAR